LIRALICGIRILHQSAIDLDDNNGSRSGVEPVFT
jgi:hypothetical protein